MRIGFVVFNGITFLDFIGFYDVVNRLNWFEETKGTTWDICGLSEEISDESGLTIKVNRIKPDLSEYDLLFVPGGMGTRKLRFDEECISWLRQAGQVQYIVSVCTGSLLLGAAGFLKNKKATTHPNAYELLEPYCKEVVKARIVRDGNVITAGGVSTSIDLALYIVELLVNKGAVEIIKKQIDYPYERQGMIEV
ncbi:DJ-1/PfpI family protein [Paenibacillus cisolokensis]|jgi:Transcriptional regulator containing an amidase domain and an AraC-type DNA-binding HTH domain|uniref:Dimethylglycine dehydrogenase n=1 Tax=Paenibacillus cisolokensis TaxID=1658519 RepID=A0ABQ4NA41_9BACL|nr:DJ-1/PfpI family protein [Paenibacillus cisolokensis]GIQ65087.1 dimethylglycine dehydrogenase [Paenibacillus cisolokensis]